jgi:hypothetical protein
MSFRDGGIVLGAGEGKTISVLGASYTYKAAKEETRGAYALIEHTVVGDGPPPHIHARKKSGFFLMAIAAPSGFHPWYRRTALLARAKL